MTARVRLLAVDLDGTLLDRSSKLSDDNHDALHRAYESGVHIALVTGRRYGITRAIAATLGFPHFVVTTAGAAARSSEGGLLFVHTMDQDLVRNVLAHAASFRSSTFLLSDDGAGEKLICQAPDLGNPHVARCVERNAGCLIIADDLVAAVTPRVIEVLLMGGIPEMRSAAALIEASRSRHRVKALRTEYSESDVCLLDVISVEADKGLAVAELARSLGIPREAVMAIGDNFNDVHMLEYAGRAVVMGNAPAQMKRRGWHVTASNDEQGVAQAIHRFVLRRSR